MAKKLILILYDSRDFSSKSLVHALVNTINCDVPIKKLEETDSNKIILIAKKLKEIMKVPNIIVGI